MAAAVFGSSFRRRFVFGLAALVAVSALFAFFFVRAAAAAPPDHFVVSVSGGNPVAGQPFNVTVTAQDSSNNTDTAYNSNNQLITFSGPNTAPDGTAPTLLVTVDFSATPGVGTASLTLYKAETVSLEAQDGAAGTPTPPSVTVDPGAPDHFGVPNPGTQTAGQSFTETITAQDTWDNTANAAGTGYPDGPHALTFSGPGDAPNGTHPCFGATRRPAQRAASTYEWRQRPD